MNKQSQATIIVRPPDSIYQSGGRIDNGTFSSRWHFSYEQYYDRDYSHFGTLRVLNDDTLSPGAAWPLHPHRNIELVTYCSCGVCRHTDERGRGGALKKGWVQHTSTGKGMMHAEVNDKPDEPTRFIQMWFLPSEPDLEPALQQRPVDISERTNVLLPLVSNEHRGALPIASDAKVFASYLEKGNYVEHHLQIGHGAYLYVTEKGPVRVDNETIPGLGAAKIIGGGSDITITALEDAELLFIEVPLAVRNRMGI